MVGFPPYPSLLPPSLGNGVRLLIGACTEFVTWVISCRVGSCCWGTLVARELLGGGGYSRMGWERGVASRGVYWAGVAMEICVRVGMKFEPGA